MHSDDTIQPVFIELKGRAVDVAAQRFGRLTTIGPVGRNTHGQILWLCSCDCGNESVVLGARLRSGKTKSCGCWHDELAHQRLVIHGMTDNPIHAVWAGMVQRCTDPNRGNYIHYGGRGIVVCDEWLYDFKAFFDYVSTLSHCGEKGYSLDRIDNSLGYFPANVQFATKVEQSRNKRNNRMFTYNNKTQCVPAWAEEVGLNPATLSTRLCRGWSIEKALTTPVKRRGDA